MKYNMYIVCACSHHMWHIIWHVCDVCVCDIYVPYTNGDISRQAVWRGGGSSCEASLCWNLNLCLIWWNLQGAKFEQIFCSENLDISMAFFSMHRKICMGCRARFVTVAINIFTAGQQSMRLRMGLGAEAIPRDFLKFSLLWIGWLPEYYNA